MGGKGKFFGDLFKNRYNSFKLMNLINTISRVRLCFYYACYWGPGIFAEKKEMKNSIDSSFFRLYLVF